MKFRSYPYLIQLLLLTILFAGLTRLGLLFSYVETTASQVWSPAGLSIMVLFAAGPRFLPAVVLGTAMAYLFVLPSIPAALILSAGSGLEAVIGYLLLKKVRFDPSICSLPEVGKLVLVSGGVSTAANALFSVLWYSLFAPQVAEKFFTYLMLWWMGNLMGVIAIAPAVCLILSRRLTRWNKRRITEFIIL
ncbi:MAG: MASE1 domain-containing protein, partial [Bacteroidetes bacterium]|nr:MASE1 domain-containing protein [Bacteroidota bacterium]